MVASNIYYNWVLKKSKCVPDIDEEERYFLQKEQRINHEEKVKLDIY